jgi:DNA-binding response OmpR family regulator
LKKKILVIDDKEELLMLVEIIFQEIGYEIICLKDSEEAFEYVIREKPDIVILDIMMPKLNGWDVLKQIKEHPSTSSIPILILSVKADREDAEKSKKLGAEAIMRKPFKSNKLIEAVNKILNQEKK